MKTAFYYKKLFVFLLCFGCWSFTMKANAQAICTDNVNVVYGLNTTGVIRPINLNTGVAGAKLDSIVAVDSAFQSNALG